MHLVKASVSSSRVFGLRQESPDRLDVFSIFSFFTNSSSFFLTTSSCCCFLAGSSFFLTKSSCLRMMERFLASATEGGNGDCESLSRGEARPVVCKKQLETLEQLMMLNMTMEMLVKMTQATCIGVDVTGEAVGVLWGSGLATDLEKKLSKPSLMSPPSGSAVCKYIFLGF